MLKTIQKLVLVLLCINICNATIYSSCCVELLSKCFSKNKSRLINNESQNIIYTCKNTEFNDETQDKTYSGEEVSDTSIPNYFLQQNTSMNDLDRLLQENNENAKCLLKDNSKNIRTSNQRPIL